MFAKYFNQYSNIVFTILILIAFYLDSKLNNGVFKIRKSQIPYIVILLLILIYQFS